MIPPIAPAAQLPTRSWCTTMIRHLPLALAFLSLLPAVLSRAEATDVDAAASVEPPQFEKDVRPILKAHCWHCHGEEEELKGGIDARLARLLIKGGDSGPGVVPGKHGESLLYQRMASEEMPPGKRKPRPQNWKSSQSGLMRVPQPFVPNLKRSQRATH